MNTRVIVRSRGFEVLEKMVQNKNEKKNLYGEKKYFSKSFTVCKVKEK